MAQVQNKILKSLRLVLFSIALIILIGCLSFAYLLSTNNGHLLSAKLLSNFLTAKLKTKVTIESLTVHYHKINMKNIRIYDYKNNILLDVKNATGYYSTLNSTNVDFNRIDVDGGTLNVALYDEEGAFNISLVVNRISSGKKDPRKPDFKLQFRNANIKNVKFSFHRPVRETNYGKINYDNMAVGGITGNVTDFEIYKGKVSFHVSKISCTEKCGFRIHHLSTDFSVDSTEMGFRNFFALTNESKVKGSYVMKYRGYMDFKKFEKMIQMNGVLENSIVSFSDLSYFAKPIKTNEKSLRITGSAYGTLDNLKSKHIQIFFGKESNYSGSFNMNGLPEITETFFDLQLKNSAISFRDITRLVPSAKFPDYFYNMGAIKVNGTYTGFANDFVANAFFRTKLGNIKTDINFKIKPEKGATEYSGNLKLDNFDLGSFVEKKDYLGRISMNGSIAGKGLTLEDVKADIDVSISTIDFNKYIYQNINYKGFIAQKNINGTLTIHDPNIELNFKGNIDLTQPKPIYSYVASLHNTNFQNLHISKRPMILDCNMDMKLTANNIDDIEGKIVITNASIILNNKTHSFEKIEVTSQLLAGLKRISVVSDIVKADLSGNYSLKTIHKLFQSTFLAYVDSSFNRKKLMPYPDNFVDFSVNIIKADLINALIHSNISIDDGLILKGTLNNKRNNLTISGKIPGFRYKKFYLKGIILGIDNKYSKTLNVDILCSTILNKDSLLLNDIVLSTKTNRDLISFGLAFQNKLLSSNVILNGKMDLNIDSAEVSFSDSKLNANNVDWKLAAKNIKILFTPEIRIPLFELTHENQTIKLLGIISKNSPDPIRILLDNVKLDYITYYFKNLSETLGGTINGQIVIYDFLSKPYFDAGMVINPMIYRKTDTLGIVTATSNHNAYTNQTFVQGTLQDKNLEELLNVDGYVDLVDKKVMDLKFDLVETDLNHFEFFVRGLFSNIQGKVSGKMSMRGPVSKPKVEGYADISKAFFTIDYLKTTYHFDHKIRIDEKNFWLKNATVYDAYENPVSIDGVIKHNMFTDYFFDINVEGKKGFLGLNTTESDNSFYYGQAFASGDVHISGPIQAVHMDLQIKSEKNTKLFLTTFNKSVQGQSRSIRFTSKSDKPLIKRAEAPKGLTLNIDMDITPDADIELIMDPNYNDVIKGNGKGNLKFELDYFGNMNMYGNYTIDNGEYYFTALDVIKRKFTVSAGSQVSWKGDPFTAMVNIEAFYPIEASVYDLVSDAIPEEERKAYRQTVPVKAKIYLTESLFAPNVKLDFDILNTRSISGSNVNILEQKIRFIKNDEQELNKQVISLLVIHSFMPVNTGNTGNTLTGGINTNVSSLISTQVTQWMSELSDNFIPKYFEDFQIGLNYNPENIRYQKQLELAMSTTLFNDRVTLNGSYDVENKGNNFEVNYQLKKGNDKVRLKVFTRSDNNPIYQETLDRQGIGIFFRKEFNKFGDLFRKEKNTVIN
jgi:hypothetical protein